MSVFLRPAKVNIFWAEAKSEIGNNWGEIMMFGWLIPCRGIRGCRLLFLLIDIPCRGNELVLQIFRV